MFHLEKSWNRFWKNLFDFFANENRQVVADFDEIFTSNLRMQLLIGTLLPWGSPRVRANLFHKNSRRPELEKKNLLKMGQYNGQLANNSLCALWYYCHKLKLPTAFHVSFSSLCPLNNQQTAKESICSFNDEHK